MELIPSTPKIKGKKNPWSKEEDEILVHQIKMFGARKWSDIAEALLGRTGKQCRERWHNHLKVGISKDPWTISEEWTLFLGIKLFGHSWSKISSFLEGRSDNGIKNHWNCKMRYKIPALQKEFDKIIRKT